MASAISLACIVIIQQSDLPSMHRRHATECPAWHASSSYDRMTCLACIVILRQNALPGMHRHHTTECH